MKMSWIVWLGIAAMAGLMAAAGLGANIIFPGFVLIAFGALLDAYVGVDQFAAVMTTRQMPKGERFSGNRKKLLSIVFASFALTVEAFCFQGAAAKANRPLELPAMEFFAIFLFAAMLLTGGEKVKTANEGVSE